MYRSMHRHAGFSGVLDRKLTSSIGETRNRPHAGKILVGGSGSPTSGRAVSTAHSVRDTRGRFVFYSHVRARTIFHETNYAQRVVTVWAADTARPRCDPGRATLRSEILPNAVHYTLFPVDIHCPGSKDFFLIFDNRKYNPKRIELV